MISKWGGASVLGCAILLQKFIPGGCKAEQLMTNIQNIMLPTAPCAGQMV